MTSNAIFADGTLSERDAHIHEAMLACADEAGTMMVEARDVAITQKSANNFVTSADIAIQKMIIEQLSRLAPDAYFLAEEKDLVSMDGEGFIIDPIDGTHNFINGLGLSAVSIAHAVDGQVVSGIVYNPFAHDLYEAAQGGGAFCNGAPIHMRHVPTRNVLTFVEDKWPGNKAVLRNYVSGSRCLGTAAIALCYLASGRGGAYISPSIHAWDYAAAMLIVREAGGVVVEKDGSDARLAEPNCIGACAPDLLPTLLTMWREAEANA